MEETDVIFLWGANARENHPIFFHPYPSSPSSISKATALDGSSRGSSPGRTLSNRGVHRFLSLASKTDVEQSYAVGKSADLVILNAGHLRDLELCLGTNLVHLTMKGGRFIYKEGEVGPLPANDLP